MTTTPTEPERFWDEHYRHLGDGGRPRANPLLIEVAGALAPGAALDLGCGAGGDSLWLAEHGWQVTATDISAAAVQYVARLTGERVRTRRHDLARTFPDGTYDLISAQYLQTPYELDRAAVLRRAAHALRVGGRLLVVDHGSIAPWSWNTDPDAHFPAPVEIAAQLRLDADAFVVDRADAPRRTATGPDGSNAEVVDHVLVVRRTR